MTEQVNGFLWVLQFVLAWFMVFNAIFNNISVLLVEETSVSGDSLLEILPWLTLQSNLL
jgi:hypothetical protein